MLIIPEEIKALYKQDNIREDTRRKWKLRFYDTAIQLLFPEDLLFPSDELFPIDQEPIYTIENDQMNTESVVLTESICESDDLTFGECNISQFEVTVADVFPDLSGLEFMVSVEIGNYEMAMGIYTVNSFKRQADKRFKKLIAYDRMEKFSVNVADWYKGLTFPMTLKALRDSLCSYVGITQLDVTLPLDDMKLEKTIEPEQLSGLNVLCAICEINGCFGHVDKTGRLKYQFLSRASVFPSDELFPADDLFPADLKEGDSELLSYYKQSETTYEDYVVTPIEKIQIRQEEGDIGAIYGEGDNCYVIQGNFLLYGKSGNELLEIAANVYSQISGRSYRPCKIVTSALPWVEVGDGILCYTTDDVIETYCFKRTMKGIQAMMDTYEAFGNIAQEENFGIHTQIIQLEGKTAVIKKSVEEVSVRVSDLKEYTEAQFRLTAEEIAAEVKRAQESEAALSIKADKIALSVTDLKNDTNSRFEQTATQIAMKVSKGEVSSQLSIEPGDVTIKTNRLSWEADNSSMTKTGILTCYGLRAVNGQFSGTLETDVFYAGDDSVQFGDFSVSADGSNTLRSNNGNVIINSHGPESGSPGGDYAAMHIGGQGYNGITLRGDTGKVECSDVVSLGCDLAHGSTRIWGLGETIDWVWEKFQELEDRIDNLS